MVVIWEKAKVFTTPLQQLISQRNFKCQMVVIWEKAKVSQLVTLSSFHCIVITDQTNWLLLYFNLFKFCYFLSFQFRSKPRRGDSLGKEHEIFLAEIHCQNVPVFVIDWPRYFKILNLLRNRPIKFIVVIEWPR